MRFQFFDIWLSAYQRICFFFSSSIDDVNWSSDLTIILFMNQPSTYYTLIDSLLILSGRCKNISIIRNKVNITWLINLFLFFKKSLFNVRMKLKTRFIYLDHQQHPIKLIISITIESTHREIFQVAELLWNKSKL